MMKIFPLISLLLLIVLGCKYLSPAQKLESEATTENPKRTISDSLVFLNSGSVGKISDLKRAKRDVIDLATNDSTVADVLSDVIKEREKNGVFMEGTNVTPSSVYLIANPELAIGPLAELYIAIDENAGDVYIRRKNAPRNDGRPQKPNPFTLEVRTVALVFGGAPEHDWPIYDPRHRFTYSTSFEFVKTPDSLLSSRAWVSSVELSADERYFVNDKQGPEADEGPKYTQVKQRPIEPAALTSELAKIVEPINKYILIIASEKASYASLLKIFEAAPGGSVKLQVLVRRSAI